MFCTAGVLAEMAVRPKEPDMPTEEEFMEMQMQGIQYSPPPPEPIDETTQQRITTFGIMAAAVGMSLPKSVELFRKAEHFKNLNHAQADAGLFEQQVMKLYGRKSTV